MFAAVTGFSCAINQPCRLASMFDERPIVKQAGVGSAKF